MSFDTLAPHYRWMEWLLAGGKLQRCRTAFLPEIADAKKVLILGEGNGRFLVECRRSLPNAAITCVDASARMLQLAGRRLERARPGVARVEFVHADVLDWRPPQGEYDLIVTHFFLDCFAPGQLELLVEMIAAAAAPDTQWLVADFAVPTKGVARYRAAVIHQLMYGFFRLAAGLPAQSLTCPDKFLRARGFELRERRRFEWGLLHTDRWKRRECRLQECSNLENVRSLERG